MRVMLASCGLETEQVKDQFPKMLGKASAGTLQLSIGQTTAKSVFVGKVK